MYTLILATVSRCWDVYFGRAFGIYLFVAGADTSLSMPRTRDRGIVKYAVLLLRLCCRSYPFRFRVMVFPDDRTPWVATGFLVIRMGQLACYVARVSAANI